MRGGRSEGRKGRRHRRALLNTRTHALVRCGGCCDGRRKTRRASPPRPTGPCLNMTQQCSTFTQRRGRYSDSSMSAAINSSTMLIALYTILALSAILLSKHPLSSTLSFSTIPQPLPTHSPVIFFLPPGHFLCLYSHAIARAGFAHGCACS